MTPRTTKILTIFFCGILLLGLSGCASSRGGAELAQRTAGIHDPIEPVNRAIFSFNNIVDVVLIEPAAKVYTAVVPGFARDAVQNFMRNLKSPLLIANNLLQGKFGDAGVATARFLINTTAGAGGLADVASTHGLSYKQEDFGQTLAKWGAGHGFYLVLPIIGPSSLRDATGLAVDTLADPVRIVAHKEDKDWIYYARGVLEGLDFRARLVDAVRDLRRSSLDYYAAVRSAYVQKRAALVRDDNPDAPAATIKAGEDYYESY